MFVLILLLATMLLTDPFNKQELTSVISILYYTELSGTMGTARRVCQSCNFTLSLELLGIKSCHQC